MDRKQNFPDSDESARKKHPDAATANVPDADTSISNVQTSNKSGKHSTAEKLAASRPEFGTGRGGVPVDGAFGDDPNHVITGRNAGPETNKYRCETCGRWFNTREELAEHEPECQLAKAASNRG